MVDSLLEIIAAAGSQKFYKPIEVYSMTNAIDEIGVSMSKRATLLQMKHFNKVL